MTPDVPVAVTGIGCLSAAGPDLASSIESMSRGERHSGLPTRFSTGHPAAHPVFEVPDRFIPPDYLDRTGLTLTAILALSAARAALADTGWREDPGARFGVCVGTTVGTSLNSEAFYREYRDGRRPAMDPIERFLRSNPADVLAAEFGFHGLRQTVVNACSSGTDAIGIAAGWIRAGWCDAVLAGGADELCRTTQNGFISLMIADTDACRPFDAGRRGLNLGEGAAVLLLESDPHRRRRARKARSFVLGYGSAADAHHLTAPHPEGRGLRSAIGTALTRSAAAPADLVFVNAHGTGTPDNDRVEGRVLADLLPGVPFLSTKAFTGHTLGAAGAIEAAFTAAMLQEGRIPPQAGFSTPDPGIGVSPVTGATTFRGAAALSDSLAFGGSNAAVVLARGEA